MYASAITCEVEKRRNVLMQSKKIGNCQYNFVFLNNLLTTHKTIVCPFGIGKLASQKKREKLFRECIFGLLNLKRKINIKGQHVNSFSHIGDCRYLSG